MKISHGEAIITPEIGIRLAGDKVPKGHETGIDAIEKVGTALAVKALDAILIATRNLQYHKLTNE